MSLRKLFASFLLLTTVLIGGPVNAQQLPGDVVVPPGQPAQPTLAAPLDEMQPGPLVPFHNFILQLQNAPNPAAPTPQELENLYHQVWEKIGESYHLPGALKDWGNWEHKYDGKLQKPEDLDKALKEMVGSLNDRWTQFRSAAELAEARKLAASGVVSLGLSFKQEADGSFRIDYLAYGSPAHKSDLRKGDNVKSIGGKSLKGLSADEAEKLTQGKAGTKVKVVYNHSGKDETVELVFAATPDASVESKLLPGDIAYVRLPDFSSELVILEFLAAIDDLNKQAGGKLEGIVLDLRGNPGGQFQLAILVSSLFLEKGTIVTSTTRQDRLITHQTFEVIPILPHTLAGQPADTVALVQMLQKLPMTVLTDGSTASAAEIVTGALKDNARATIIGGTTYGKAVGYVRFTLPNGGTLLITTLDYLTPSGFNLSNKGIQPNQAVDQPRGSQVDEQLNSGVKQVKEQIQQQIQPPVNQKSDADDSPYRSALLVSIMAVALVTSIVLLFLRRRKQ